MRQDDGMMELVLHDLMELQAPWLDAIAKRGVVTCMYVALRCDLVLAGREHVALT